MSGEAGAEPTTAQTPSEKLRQLLSEDFDFQIQGNPEFATQAGFHAHDAFLQSLTPVTFDQRVEHNKEMCSRLSAILEESKASESGKLSDAELLHARLFQDAVETETRGIEVGGHLMPINSIGNGGVHESFLELLDWMRFEDEEDFEKYLERLMSFPGQVADFTDLLAYGACMKGRSASKAMMYRVEERLQELLDGAALKALRQPLEGKTLSDELRGKLEQGFKNGFIGGLERLKNFLSEFYVNRVRAEPGCGALREGEAFYAECLRFHTTTSKSAKELHDLGLAEVARIEGRFQKEVLDVVGFTGTFVEYAASLKADPAWFYTSEDELLAGYRSLVTEISSELPRLFPELQKTPLEVVAKRSGPAAYYYAGTADGSRPGYFYVNVSRLNERPRYEMIALALHEGIPGHHLQGSLALENEDIPDFLRYIEDRRYEYCPARRPLYTAYLEGWALYCEWLGEELGLYRTPQDLFGRLSMEMMRAVRLVVDTGIHSLGWSVEKAAAYMEEKTGMASEVCNDECNRYASWPGQAVAYKFGELHIRAARKRAEEKLGTAFDIKAFHTVLLGSGPLPLDVLDEKVDAWIARGGGSA
eukprot:TRINITY_DN14498_c0_g1_i1.p1 TRINITY_DN14498_c0_g1~~TRINITY_DN14498_c0_g1_i1.p1  ORF type:complete len:617 (+),score=112.26 TRINITY_DN14498_c0_g1_i1:84-1853(+)